MSYHALSLGDAASGLTCGITSIDSLSLTSHAVPIWNSLKLCVRKSPTYLSQNEIAQIWACDVSPWKQVIRSALTALLVLCPSGSISNVHMLPKLGYHGHPMRNGMYSIDAALAAKVWELAHSQGYHVSWTLILYCVRTIYRAMV